MQALESESQTPRKWVDTKAVATRLGCSRVYLRRVMGQTPPHIVKAWVEIGTGTGTRARYSWELARVDDWWREVHEWQASRDTKESSSSDGKIRTAQLTLAAVPMPMKPANSNVRSKRRSPSDGRGGLMPLSEILSQKA